MKEQEKVEKKSKRITRDKYIGRKYNMLTIVEFDHYEKNFLACFKCRCDCGNLCTAKINQLKTGTKKVVVAYANRTRKTSESGAKTKLPTVNQKRDSITFGRG